MLARTCLALFTACFAVVFTCASASADPPALVAAVSLRQANAGAELFIDLDQPAKAKIFQLPAPNPRLVIDLPPTLWASEGRAAETGAGRGIGPVRGIRYAKREGASRLVLDLSRPVTFSQREEPGREGGVRLLIGLDAAAPPSSSRPSFAAAPVEPPAALPPVAAETVGPMASLTRGSFASPRAAALKQERPIIVLDAGHGGKDPGAISVSGKQEKAITLAAVQQLRSALLAKSDFDVRLTRGDDTYIALSERVRRARADKADLFISLHADSHVGSSARGAAVYTLSQHGNERAKSLINKENWDIDLGDAPKVGSVQNVLVDLTQRETTDKSAEFAQKVIGELSGVAPLLQRSHRNAGFFVLLAPDVPAVLIEMGFLSDSEDERRISTAAGRRPMIEALAGAIAGYFQAGTAYAEAGGDAASTRADSRP